MEKGEGERELKERTARKNCWYPG